jgi:hypothetical protein
VLVTRLAGPMAHLICNHDIQVPSDLRTGREAANRWYAQYRQVKYPRLKLIIQGFTDPGRRTILA